MAALLIAAPAEEELTGTGRGFLNRKRDAACLGSQPAAPCVGETPKA